MSFYFLRSVAKKTEGDLHYVAEQSSLICASGERRAQAQNATFQISADHFDPNLYMTIT